MGRYNAKAWLVCVRCGRKDISETVNGRRYTGTRRAMLCLDCREPGLEPQGLATLCRRCCPTGHGTHAEVKTPAAGEVSHG